MAQSQDAGVTKVGNKDVWYDSDVEIQESMRKILELYSGIAPADILSYVHKVVDEIKPGRSFHILVSDHGIFSFWVYCISRDMQIRDRLKQGQTLVDLGCAFAQDIRQLMCDGVPAENLYGVELDERLVDLGYSLFLDREKLRSLFLVADVSEEYSDLDYLNEKVDVVYASQLFHLFGWDNQVTIGKRMVRLLKPQSGSLIVGYQVGTLDTLLLSPAPTLEG